MEALTGVKFTLSTRGVNDKGVLTTRGKYINWGEKKLVKKKGRHSK
jgi:hypothetical protein